MTARVEPDDAMMVPVRAVADFMRTLDAASIAGVFVDDVVIVENFAPYIFRGPSAAARWQAGFREHAATLSDLRNSFGEALDFSSDGDTAYFVLPTVWTGQIRGKPFAEEGGWAFVLERQGEGWRIASYAWAVTAFRLV